MTATHAARDRQFARLLCANAEEGSSGILTASRGKLKRLFCLSKGWIVFATSNLIEEQFIEYLVRTGAMSPRMRAEAIEESARVNKKAISYLVATGTPTKDALRRAMEGLIRELTTSTLEWPDGAYAFQEGLPQLDGEVTVRIPARSLVFAHARRYPASLDALRIRIGPPDLHPVATASAIADSEEMEPLGAYIVARCDGTVQLSDLVAGSPAEEEPTLRMLYGYLLAGLVEPEDREARRTRESSDHVEVLSREECLGRLTMASGQDHYGVLGVDRTARLKSIREAYYALARRYHPDRFRAGPLSDLLPRFEDFFMSVTEAYNTLSDKESRLEYDEQLASAHGKTESSEADTGYLARQNFLRGRALAAQRKFTEAVTFLENAISLDPGQADFHLELGLVLSRNPRHREDAERHLLQTIELKPTAVAAYVALGRMYQRANKLGRAMRMAREALRWEPGHVEAGELFRELGNVAEEPGDLREGLFRSS